MVSPLPTAKLMHPPLIQFPKGNNRGRFRVKYLNLVYAPRKLKIG